MPGPFDREGELALVPGTSPYFSARADLASLREVAPQRIPVLIVNVSIGIGTEGADAADRRSVAARATTCRISVATPLGSALVALRAVTRAVAHGAARGSRRFGILGGWRGGRFLIVHFLNQNLLNMVTLGSCLVRPSLAAIVP